MVVLVVVAAVEEVAAVRTVHILTRPPSSHDETDTGLWKSEFLNLRGLEESFKMSGSSAFYGIREQDACRSEASELEASVALCSASSISCFVCGRRMDPNPW